MFSRKFATAIAVSAGIATSLMAQTDGELINAAFTVDGVEGRFTQSQTLNTALIETFHQPIENCGAVRIAPNTVSADIQTVSEREVIAFVASTVSAGNGLLIDSLEPEKCAACYISASVNVPTSLVQPENPYLSDIMLALGARSFEGTLNFSDATPLIIFDDGPTTLDAPALITQLLAQGYPADKSAITAAACSSGRHLDKTQRTQNLEPAQPDTRKNIVKRTLNYRRWCRDLCAWGRWRLYAQPDEPVPPE